MLAPQTQTVKALPGARSNTGGFNTTFPYCNSRPNCLHTCKNVEADLLSLGLQVRERPRKALKRRWVLIAQMSPDGPSGSDGTSPDPNMTDTRLHTIIDTESKAAVVEADLVAGPGPHVPTDQTARNNKTFAVTGFCPMGGIGYVNPGRHWDDPNPNLPI